MIDRANQLEAPLLITPAEAARLLGLDRLAADPARTVRDMARRGELVAVRVSRYTLISRASVDKLARPRP